MTLGDSAGNGSSKAEHAVLEIWMKYNYLQKAFKDPFLFYKQEGPRRPDPFLIYNRKKNLLKITNFFCLYDIAFYDINYNMKNHRV